MSIDKQQILYLSHPCSTFGNIQQNIKTAGHIKDNLYEKGYIIISPVGMIPTSLTWDDAMDVSYKLYAACQGLIIGAKHWLYSNGCTKEVLWAILEEKPIYLYDEQEKIIKKATLADIKSFKDMIIHREKILGETKAE